MTNRGTRYFKLDNVRFLEAATAAKVGAEHQRLDFQIGRIGGLNPDDLFLNKEMREAAEQERVAVVEPAHVEITLTGPDTVSWDDAG